MGKLMPLPVPDGRWERIGIDFITKLPKSNGFDSICTIVDHLSKSAHFFPMKEATTAAEFAPMFIRNHFKLHGMPGRIVSDRDVRFMSDFWKRFVKDVGSAISPSTPFHPQTDGAVEKVTTSSGPT